MKNDMLTARNPHDQAILGQRNATTLEEVERAVRQARSAQREWGTSPIEHRLRFLEQYKHALTAHKEDLALNMAVEMGRPRQHCRWDIDGEIRQIEYHQANAARYLSDTRIVDEPGMTYDVRREAHGVCVCITSWNFPLSMVNSGVLPALLAGNTVVLKTSERAFLVQEYIAQLLQSSGLPDDVLKVVRGGAEQGRMLLEQDIDFVWFTGSTSVGRFVYRRCGEKFIRSVCEMGGSSAGIVFDDAHLDHAVEQLYLARFNNSGQVCKAVKRLFVHEQVYEDVVIQLTDRLHQVRMGNPLEEVDMGPLVNPQQLHLIHAQLANAWASGARAAYTRNLSGVKDLAYGNYCAPTLLINVTQDLRVMQEEVFGPVLPIMPFATEDEAVQLANNSPYGLSHEVYTEDAQRAARLAARLDAGTIAINTDRYYRPDCPVGGFKQSGIGKQYGQLGLEEFTKAKIVAQKWTGATS